MKFHIDFAAFASTLPVMLLGMIGGIVVMGMIWGVLWALYHYGAKVQK